MAKKEERKKSRSAKAEGQEDAQAKQRLDELVNRCMVFTDRNGKVLDKGSHPFSAWLKMKYEGMGLTIEFRAQNSPHSNGSSSLKVRWRGKIVLDASGKFITSAYDAVAKTYVPGAWEKKIPPMPPRER